MQKQSKLRKRLNTILRNEETNKEKYQENIVPAVNQNNSNVYIYGESGFRVLFVGNSITKYRPKPDIGWNNDCGMAASAPENDYVHLLMKNKVRVSS